MNSALTCTSPPAPRRAARARDAVAALLTVSLAFAPLMARAGALKRAPNARTIVLVDLSPDDKEHAEILFEIRRAVEAHQSDKGLYDYDVRDVHVQLNAGGEEADQRNAATAKGLVDAGRGAMEAKDFEDASDQFLSALKLCETSSGVFEDANLLGEVLLRLGEARLAAGDAEGSTRALRRAASTRADATILTAEGKAAYQRAEAELAALPLGAVQINTNPPYAEIYVDGRFKGVSPKAVAGLIEGPHVITVYKDGYTRPTVLVEVSSSKMAHAEIKLEPARRALLLNELKPRLVAEIAAAQGPDPKGGPAVKEVGDLFRAETSLVVRIDGTPELKSVELYLFHRETQRLVATVRVPELDWSFKNRAAIEGAVARLLKVNWAEVLGGDVDDGAVAESSILEAWWFWTLVGVGVAGGTAAVLLATQEDAPPPPYAKDGTGAMVLRF